MRKLMISLATAGAAVAFATPAAAQYYPQPQPYGQPYGYGAPYGNAYGYTNRGYVRSLQVRVDQIQRNLNRLAQRRLISSNEYRNRNQEAREIERRLRRDARDGRGLTGQEINQIQYRIARLEQRIARDTRDGGRWGYNNYNSYNNGYYNYDRDRDGRDDRWEDDQGYRRDR